MIKLLTYRETRYGAAGRSGELERVRMTDALIMIFLAGLVPMVLGRLSDDLSGLVRLILVSGMIKGENG